MNDHAVRFLRWLGHSKPHVYTIEPDGKFAWRQCTKDTLPSILAEKKNTYYSPAKVKPGHNSRADKTELVSTRHLHVDLDPDKQPKGDSRTGDKWLKDELDRLLGLVLDDRPKEVPEPSAIVLSGRGVQALWTLDAAVSLPKGQEDVEAANRWLMGILGAPAGTHDVTRVLRLPGSWNPGDAKKLAAGFIPCFAKIFDTNDKEYALSDFGAIRDKSPSNSTTSTAGGSTYDGKSAKMVQDLSELDPYRLPWRIIHLISRGHPGGWLDDYTADFGAPNKDPNDRNLWVHDVCCNLVRAGVPDEIIAGLISDPDWAISAHVLAQGHVPRYVKRQIDRAYEKVKKDPPKAPPPPGATQPPSSGGPPQSDIDKAVEGVNAKHFACLNGGKIKFYLEEEDGTLSGMNQDAFKFHLGGQSVRVGNKWQPIYNVWLSHSRRRYFPGGFVLDPNYKGTRKYNLWKGFGVQPKQGDWSLMRRHVLEVLASGNEAHAQYILDWTAWSFQNPAIPAGTALVFRGTEGIGKGLFCNALVRAFGAHGLRVQSMTHLVGRFNAHLRHLCLLFADEAVAAGSAEEGTLKGLITEPHLPIEGKGLDVVKDDNHLHVCMASNHDYVVPAGKDARRYGVFDVSDRYRGNPSYFTALRNQLANGGVEAMLFDMLAQDLGNFSPIDNCPRTKALDDQKALSLPKPDSAVLMMLKTGIVAGFWKADGATVFVSTRKACQALKLDPERDTVALSKSLMLASDPDIIQRRARRGKRMQASGFWLGKLPEARARWAEAMKLQIDWPQDVLEWDKASMDHEENESDGEF